MQLMHLYGILSVINMYSIAFNPPELLSSFIINTEKDHMQHSLIPTPIFGGSQRLSSPNLPLSTKHCITAPAPPAIASTPC